MRHRLAWIVLLSAITCVASGCQLPKLGLGRGCSDGSCGAGSCQGGSCSAPPAPMSASPNYGPSYGPSYGSAGTSSQGAAWSGGSGSGTR